MQWFHSFLLELYLTRTSLQDRFAEGRFLPPVDEHQDWFLVRGEEEGGFTTLEFTRNFTSCDTKDRSIQV